MKYLRNVMLLAGAMIVLASQNSVADVVAVQQFVNGESVLTMLRPGPIDVTTIEDPRVIVRRLIRGSVPFSGLNFSFDALTGTGNFDYYNGNPFGLGSLTFSISPGDPGGVADSLFACGIDTQLSALPFSDCSFSQFGGSGLPTILSFSGGPGLPSHSHFDIELTGFRPDTTVSAEASRLVTPEPGMALLFLSGLCGLMAQGKQKMKFRLNS